MKTDYKPGLLFGTIVFVVLGLAFQAQALTISNQLDPSDPLYFSVDLGDSGESGWWWWRDVWFNGQNQVYEWNANLNVNGTGSFLTDFNWTAGTPTNGGGTYSQTLTTNLYGGTTTLGIHGYIPYGSNYMIETYSISTDTGLNNVKFYQYLNADLNAPSDLFDPYYWPEVTDDLGGSFGYGVDLYQWDADPQLTSIGLSGVSMSPDEYEINSWIQTFNKIQNGDPLANSVVVSGPDDLEMGLAWDLSNIGVGGTSEVDVKMTANPVPEPSSLILLGLGLASIAGLAVKRRQKTRKTTDI
jgi:hypothetical protein